MNPRSILAVAALAFALSVHAYGQQFTTERVDAGHWRIRIVNDAPSIIPPNQDVPYSRVNMSGYLPWLVEGEPQIPIKAFNFGLPPNAEITATVKVVEERTMRAPLSPFFMGDADAASRTNVTGMKPNSAKSATVTVEYGALGGVRTGRIMFKPVRIAAGTGEIAWIRSADIDVRISGAVEYGGSRVEAATVSCLINKNDAVGWASVRRTASGTRWYEPDKTMLRITTTSTGMYRLTYGNLVATGIDIGSIDPRTFKVLIDGVEQPARVRGESDGRFDPGDDIVFFIRRIAGLNGEYFDEWSDERVVWLAWGGADGRRFGVEDGTITAGGVMPSFPVIRHLEEDHLYHAGDNDYETSISEKQQGETWIWKYLRRYDSLGVKKLDSLVIPFAIRHVVDSPASLKYRIKGSSRDESRIAITVNDVVVEDTLFDGDKLVTRSLWLPAGLLREGGNSITVRSVGAADCPPTNPNCSIERVYLDWVELKYRQLLTADSGIVFTDITAYGDSVPSVEQVRMDIAGFPDTSVTVFNIDRGTIVSNAVITGAAPDVHVSFMGRSTESYCASVESAYLTPAAMEAMSIPDLPGTPAGADYMIITARPFVSAAQRLAQYRAGVDTFRTVIATVEDIYNCYNFGRKNPEAIRNYVSEAWHSWPAPAPRFLLILGDASWDPKFHLANAVNVDYIPTAGNPANDNYYVVADTSLPYMPQLSVGRIPAQTLQDANSVIDKIISYESAGPQAWNRSFLFAVGGKTTYERDTLFKPGVDATIRKWIEPNCLEARRILKSKLDIVSYNDLDTLITEMNRGTLWFQFVGHGGTRIIDMGVERPDIFATRDKYPFFVTLSCNTAHFAEPYETGLNEKFVMAGENGSIASYGTSGLGVVGYDEVLRDNLFNSLFGESVRTYGEISTRAKRKLLIDYGSGNQFVVNTANQYIILGDPATHVPLPRSPELAVTSLDITTNPEILTEGRSTRINAKIHNYGTCLTDSVDVVLSVQQGASMLLRNRRRIAPFVESTTESWQYDFARISGSVRITVEIDPDRLINESVRSNNTASVDREVLPRGIVQVFPLDCAVIPADSARVRFTVANPSYVPDASLNPSVEFQISTDPLFAVIAHMQSTAVERVYTAIDVVLPQTQPDMWYWRARLVTSQGAEEWSERRSMSFGGSGSNERWYQRKRSQFEYDTRIALEFSGDTALVPGLRNSFIEVVSAGNNQIEIEDFAEIWVDGVNVSPNHRGFNIAVIDAERGRVVDTVSYDTYADRNLAASMAQYLRNVPSDRYVAIAIRDDANGYPEYTVGGTNITQELRDAIRLFGAQYVDSIGYRDSYALLARKSQPTTAREMYRSYGPAFFKDTLQIGSDHRVIRSTVIGPASQWKTFRWDGRSGGQGSAVRLNLYKSGASSDSLIWSSGALMPGADVALALPSNVPFIKAELVSDDSTTAGGFMLNGWRFEYVSRFPEFGVTSQTIQTAIDSVEQGSKQNLAIGVRAVGYSEVTLARVRVRAENAQGASWQSDETIHLPVSGETTMSVQIPTTDMPGENTYVVTVDPEQNETEYYRGNNVFSGRYYVKHDSQVPVLNVLIDGEIPADDDVISPTPVIRISLRDASPLPVKDTSAVQVTMDGRRLWLIGNPQVEYTDVENDEEKVRIIYRPTLAKGYHTLTANAKDASGNPADSIPYQVRVLVKLDNGIEQFYPFPNPSGGPLDFTFTLTGMDVPDEIRIKIYTVAGRLVRDVKTMKDQLRIGFNRIRWDGRDEDDNMLGNGVYFYKVSVVRGGGSDEQTGKLSILR